MGGETGQLKGEGGRQGCRMRICFLCIQVGVMVGWKSFHLYFP